jgi:pilus assembly protein CpaE
VHYRSADELRRSQVENLLKILVAGRSKPAIQALARAIASPELEVRCRHISNGHSDPLYGIEQFPDLMVFHLSEFGEEELASLLERPSSERPATLVIGPAENTICARAAWKAGVYDYLEAPINEADLRESVRAVCTELQDRNLGQEGRLISVISGKGGSGSSFLAANLAHLMTISSELQVALIDLDMQFGSLAQYLNLPPKHGLIRSLDMVEHLDHVSVEACMTKHKSGLSLLSPLENEIILTRDIPIERFSYLLDLMKNSYDRVIIDQPCRYDKLSTAVLERTDHILLVVQQDLANLRNAMRLQKALLSRLAFPRDNITIVVNRYEKNAAIELADIARSMNVDKAALAVVPNSYKHVDESITFGVPMLEHAPHSSVTSALMALKSRLTGAPESSPHGILSQTLFQLAGKTCDGLGIKRTRPEAA